jgi:hypothetical protein
VRDLAAFWASKPPGRNDVGIGTADHWKAFYAGPRPFLADLVLTDKIEAVTELYATFSHCTTNQNAISVEIWCDLPIFSWRAHLSAEAVLICDDAGRRIGVTQTVIDRTRVIVIESKLRGLAGLDGLTGGEPGNLQRRSRLRMAKISPYRHANQFSTASNGRRHSSSGGIFERASGVGGKGLHTNRLEKTRARQLRQAARIVAIDLVGRKKL